MARGSVGLQAPELRVDHWIGSNGRPSSPTKLEHLGDNFKIIFNFQHWCPACHSHGFPTLKFLHGNLKGRGFGFAAIQTVFEGASVNTLDKLVINQEQYGLNIPFGHDTAADPDEIPGFMTDYQI